ncbi:hypothetical protein GYMLUDRAFT_64671 [Collybiopsis luxurians FD-317 M1]|uniref:Uncharacterized protein n=1 Tax=Collybiopsis luxurians FD-317 M1 TaxID=944289 RepID=A0A0D0CA64_9AGAR|nr:hypothetical protein GYMLUDRAFT_64671 [Collybiopsis luxurians FD-317 M1]
MVLLTGILIIEAELDNDSEISCCSSPTTADSSVDLDGITSDGDDKDAGICSVDEIEDQDSDAEIALVTGSEVGDDLEWKKSGTLWLDKDISSVVLEKQTQVNQLLQVDHIEKV